MRIGAMRSRIELQSPSSTRDTAGQLSFSYSTHSNVWAEVTQAVGDVTTADGIDQLDNYIITMHYDPSLGMSKGWRVIHGSNTLEVVTVDADDDIRETITLTARFLR
tara:strand:+ start:77 stop:397 length:321 start_codon:yes stop_codon:yes gene_type:complete